MSGWNKAKNVSMFSGIWASLITQLGKKPSAMQETLVQLLGKIHWRRDRLPTPVFLGFPCSSAGKEFTFNVGDLASIAGLGRSPGEGKGYPLQYSGLKNSMECTVHEVSKSRTGLSDFHFLRCICFQSNEKETSETKDQNSLKFF